VTIRVTSGLEHDSKRPVRMSIILSRTARDCDSIMVLPRVSTSINGRWRYYSNFEGNR
jgi:hypothetical protein